jgi:hypothetical protein
MFARLRQPGGLLGGLSVASALLLGLVGIVAVVSLVIAAATGSDFWTDDRTDQLISAVLFAVIAAGAVGFLIIDEHPWPGAALAVAGGLLMALMLFWAILPVVLGIAIGAVAILRAKVLSTGRTTASGHAIA